MIFLNAMEHENNLFAQYYANVDADLRQSLLTFRRQYPAREREHASVVWRYTTLGKGEATALFLPGAAGAYDIWWQQLLDLAPNLRVISLSYPAVESLEALASGVNAMLQAEGVERYHLIGSSMGGYLAQYLASTQPDNLISTIFANTFVPTTPVLRTIPLLRLGINVLPLPILMAIFREFTRRRLVPAGEKHPLIEAYLMEASYAGLTKNDLRARLACISQPFTPLQVKKQTFPMLTLESGNDPLIRPGIRRAMRQLYPAAVHYTLEQAGHFPYLNQAERFNTILRSVLLGEY